MLISFEGIDGCGKTTQLHLLKERLLDEGYDVNDFREPGGTEVSEFIRSILLNPEIEMHPVTELLLFSAARSELIAQKVMPELKKGHIVLLDRFYDSTVAYQGYGRKSLGIEEINKLNSIASHRVKPDLTFYIRISLQEARKRTSHQSKDRMEQSGETFFTSVIEGFETLVGKEDRFITLNATHTKDQLHDMIWDYVLNNLNG
jgi:dTMP kinase